MLDSRFDDIKAYKDKDLPIVFDRIIDSKWFISNLRTIMLPKIPDFLNQITDPSLKMYIKYKLRKIHTINDLHEHIIIDKVLNDIIKKTTNGITFSGLENLPPWKPYLFISNHRDIALDPALLNFILLTNDFPIAEIGFGNNLMVNETLTDLFRVYGSYIISRDLPKREKIKAITHLSEYIWYRQQQGHSLWIAQGKGRSKKGYDKTNPSLVKMLYLSQKRKGKSFNDFITSVNLVPVAISYEFDPVDRMKAWEVYRKETKGEHQKGKLEDMTSLVHGFKGNKGRIHFAFGEIIPERMSDEKDVADFIDRQIYSNYKLWPSNYIAYNILNYTEKYSEHYTDEEKNEFTSRFSNLKSEVREIALKTYANPLINMPSIQSN